MPILVIIEVAFGRKGLVAVWELTFEGPFASVDAHVRFQVVALLSVVTAVLEGAFEYLFRHSCLRLFD